MNITVVFTIGGIQSRTSWAAGDPQAVARGMLVSVHSMYIDAESPAPSSTMMMLHITDTPFNDLSGAQELVSPYIIDGENVGKRKWSGDESVLYRLFPEVLAELQATGQATLPWTDAVQLITDTITGAPYG